MREKKKQQLIKYASLKLVDTLVIYEREEKKWTELSWGKPRDRDYLLILIKLGVSEEL